MDMMGQRRGDMVAGGASKRGDCRNLRSLRKEGHDGRSICSIKLRRRLTLQTPYATAIRGGGDARRQRGRVGWLSAARDAYACECHLDSQVGQGRVKSLPSPRSARRQG